MLLQWFIYTMLIGGAVLALALCAERVAAIWEMPRRFVWFAALIASIGVPAALILRPAGARPLELVQHVRLDPAAMSVAPSPGRASVGELTVSRTASISMAVYIARGWLVMSLGMLGALGLGAMRLRRLRRAWRPAVVDGQRVFISDDDGPAVVGVLRPSIVLPEWAVILEANRRELMLRHEREHIEARDPALLFAASIVTALVPWNPVLWVMMRRLRLAVEIDCDARVLRATDAAREYGLLLLDVGARNALALPFAASLAERRSHLERRLLEMTSLRPSHPVVASLAFISVAGLTGVAVAQAPVPAPVTILQRAKSEARATRDLASTHAAAAVTSQRPIEVPADSPAVVDVKQSTPSADADAVQRADAGPASPARPSSVPLDTIIAWIARERPDIIRGNSQVWNVAIVIDADEQFVSIETSGALQWIDGYLSRDAIESVEVLKGPAAAFIYGEAAQNGVISIRTRMPAETIERIHADSATAAQYGMTGVAADLTAPPQPLVYIDGVRVDPENMPLPRVSRPRLAIGVEPERIDAIDVMHLAGGTIGPNSLGVVVVKLKRD